MVRFRLGILVTAVGMAVAMASGGCGRPPAHQAAVAVQPPKPVLKAPPPTPLSEKKVELEGSTPWDPAWNAFVERDLPPALLGARAARAVRPWCPRFAEEAPADKRAFWAYVFQAMAGAESGLEPATVVHHTDPAVDKIDTVSKRPVRQEGLLQLTYEDGDRYGCDFDWQRDRRLPLKDPQRTILEPRKNLDCGIRIMQNQVITQGKPLLSRTSYWSTLQPGTASYRVFAKQMANVPEPCGVGERHRRSRPWKPN